MSNDLISVIVPIYNSEKYLEKCIESIINQTYKNIEIILIDDSSTDKSLDYCKRYAKNDKRVVVIKKERNKGVSDSRNIGIVNANGRWISFVDSDDYIDKNMIKTMYDAVVKTNSNICICNYYSVSEEKIIRNNIRNKKLKTFTDEITSGYGGFLWNKLYNRELFENQQLNVDVHICEDLLFNFELAEKFNIKFCCVDEPLYYYRANGTGDFKWKSDYSKLKVLRFIIDYYKKNGEYKIADNYKLDYMSEYLITKKYNKIVCDEDNNYYEYCKKSIKLKNIKYKGILKYISVVYFKNIYLKGK